MKLDLQNGFKGYRKYYQSLEPALSKPKTRTYTTAIFTFLAVSLFALYAIKPTIQTILFLRKEINEKTEMNKKMEEKIAQLIEAQSSYQEAEPLLPLLTQAIPTSAEALSYARQIRNLAEQTSVSLTSITASSVPLTADAIVKKPKNADKNAMSELSTNVVVSGTFDTLRMFIDGLINMRRITTIEGYVIEANTEKKSGDVTIRAPGPLQLVLRLKAYYSEP